MKTNSIILSGLFLLLGGCAATDGDGTAQKEQGVDLTRHRQVVLTVYGLSCPLCSNNLDGQLRRIDGVKDATIDLKTGAVKVLFTENHAVSEKDLARAVKDAGFTLKKIETDGGER